MKRFLIILLFSVLPVSVFSQIKIYTTNNKVIDCSFVENKRFGVAYTSTNSTDGTKDYIPHSKVDRIEYPNGDIEYISGSPTKDHKNRVKKDPKDFTYLSPNYVSFNVGPAFGLPNLLDYNSQYTGNGAGEATTGFQTSIDAAYSPDILSGISGVASVGYAYNPFNSGVMLNTLQSQLPANANNIKTQVVGWNNIHFMIGVGYYFEISNRFIVEAKGMIGGLYSYHPTVTALYDTSGIAMKTTLSSQDLFFGVSGQASARYFITRKLSVRAGLNFVEAGGGFSNLERKDYQNSKLVSQSNVAGPGDASIEWIGITIGVAYTLGK